MEYKALQNFVEGYSRELDAFFKGSAKVASKEALLAYRELAIRYLSGAYQKFNEVRKY